MRCGQSSLKEKRSQWPIVHLFRHRGTRSDGPLPAHILGPWCGYGGLDGCEGFDDDAGFDDDGRFDDDEVSLGGGYAAWISVSSPLVRKGTLGRVSEGPSFLICSLDDHTHHDEPAARYLPRSPLRSRSNQLAK